MARQLVGIGSSANDGTGDTLRDGIDKVNDNFSEIYTLLGTGSALTSGLSATASVVTLGSAVLTTPTISGAVSGTQTSATITTLTNTTLNSTTVNAGTATLAAGSLTDSSGAIDFGNENLTTTGTLASGAITTSANLTINSSAIVFEGASADAYETTVTVTDPTADRTITIPNITGTVVTTGDTNSVTGTMIAADTVAEANMANDAIGSAELKSVATLLIKNSSGSTLKTIYGAGA